MTPNRSGTPVPQSSRNAVSGALRPWQRTLYRWLLLPLGVMAANSIYLLAFTRYSAFFMSMLLLHLVLGLLLTVPLFTFVISHARRMFRTRNRRAKVAGLSVATLALLIAATGLIMTWQGATIENRAVYLIHVLAFPAAIIAFILHRRAHSHHMAFRSVLISAVSVAMFLGVMAIYQYLEKPPQRIVNQDGDTQYFPSSAETFDQGLIDPVRLSDNEYCRECHPRTYERWEKSAHRLSSFNNPFYRRSVELTADRVGREKTKWCAGCHDPVVLFSGKMGKATLHEFSYDDFEAQQGLTCMSCHSITQIKDLSGNASYVIEESTQYPFAFSDNKYLREVNKLLIRMEPSLHRKTFMKPFMRTPEFCSTCHKVALLPSFNEYKWLRGQNHYDSWQASGVSGEAVASFYDPPAPRSCRDCHLPAYPAEEFGARDGKLHDHAFPAANTALRFIEGDAEGEQFIRDFLTGAVTVDLFAIRRGGQVLPIGPALPTLHPGETVDVEVVVRTRRLGHSYTNGTADSNETWVSFNAKNADRTLMESGSLGADGRLDQSADRLSQLILDRDSRQMDRRQPTDIHATLYNNSIPPGAARVVHYRFKVPDDAIGSITLKAGVHYRKFSRDFAIFALGPNAPALPVTDLSEDGVTLPVSDSRVADSVASRPTDDVGERANSDPLWLRWNDYGIGLFLQGDLKGAGAAWETTASLAPDQPDGPLNRARALLKEGDFAEAQHALDEAERRHPGWAKTRFFRAMLAKDRGQLETSLEELLVVTKQFPRDRAVWNQVARVQFLLGRFEDALESIDRVFDVDPEDLTGHYTAMLSLKALGRKDEAAVEERWYKYHKDDETAASVMAGYRRDHPFANRESLPVHVHDNVEPVAPPAPDWIREIGPSGYEYQGTVPYGETTLKDDRPPTRQAKRPAD
ncbi:multiheme c-type cytochrome [Dokdonella sp.]|uniref:multiheme c-type cytochrome n=1 Tax=Dokdonella sp. TaxID=2291710 RepID=UPI003C5FDB72